MPEGKMLTRWAQLMAFGPSRRQRPGKPTRSMDLILPMQPVPTSSSVPVIMVTFSVRFKCETNSTAFAVAESHSARALALIVQEVGLSANLRSKGCTPLAGLPEESLKRRPKAGCPRAEARYRVAALLTLARDICRFPRMEDTEVGFPAIGNTGASLTEVGNHDQVIYLPIDG